MLMRLRRAQATLPHLELIHVDHRLPVESLRERLIPPSKDSPHLPKLTPSSKTHSTLRATETLTESPAFTPAALCISLSIIRKNFFERGTMKLSSKGTRFKVPETG